MQERVGAMKGRGKLSRRGRLMVAAALMTGFWAIAIPIWWP
jgi:hypothetical protein